MISITPGDKFIRVADSKEFVVEKYDPHQYQSVTLAGENESIGCNTIDLVAMLQAGTLRRVEAE